MKTVLQRLYKKETNTINEEQNEDELQTESEKAKRKMFAWNNKKIIWRSWSYFGATTLQT